MNQTRRTETFARTQKKPKRFRAFDYKLNFKKVNFREEPDLYRVGVGEQGVLLVEPYKSEILPHWKFKDPAAALRSAKTILAMFNRYKRATDFVGMDMARKFLQMGYTRSRRYANHASGRKYDGSGKVLPFANDSVKAKSAEIFFIYWKKAEADQKYSRLKSQFKNLLG